jgi:large subunit ribosomal protein L15
MATRLRKVRRLRGSRTHGWGQIGQHRDTGKKGNRKVGLHKHKWTQAVLIEGKYFGKHGFHNPISKVIERWVNLSALDDLFIKYGKVDEYGKRLIDLKALGYEKLLGAGNVSNAYKVVIPLYTNSAKSKIEKAGGVIVSC